MKGSAGFLELTNIQGVAHSAENLLDLVRSDKILLQQDHVDLLCQACDFTKEALVAISREFSDQSMEEHAGLLSEALRQAIELALAPPAENETTGDPDPEPLSFEMVITPEMKETFCREAEELLDKIEQGFLAWHESSRDPEIIGELFRNIHSLKGNCGFLGLADLETLAHRIETVLAGVKDGEELISDHPETILLQLVDVLREAVAEVAGGGAGAIADLRN
jgi:two-component system chemotaxis sensor kinase CheA